MSTSFTDYPEVVTARELRLDAKIIASVSTSFALLGIYILTVGALDAKLFGVVISTAHILCAVAIGSLCVGTLMIWILKRQFIARSVLQNISITACALFTGLIFLDVGYSVFLNLSQPQAQGTDDRFTDANTWVGELYPQLYYPTEKNFFLHKPSNTIHGSHYGDMYEPNLLASHTLSSSVFTKKELTISINADGFRDTGTLQTAKIVALGDSFTFGWGVDQDRTWVELLEQSLGESVYNLGIHNSSPMQEFLLLEHLIESKKVDLSGGLLLWTIFEGNDLEDSYQKKNLEDSYQHKNRPKIRSLSRRMFKDTIVESLFDLPSVIKRQSVLATFKEGVATFSGLSGSPNGKDAYAIDGVPSAFPVYVSPRFGVKLFHPTQLKRAQSPKEYVDSHPNRVPLEKTFQNMSFLAQRVGFTVVVIIAPTDARLYGQYFDNFPTLSDEPYFNELILELSRQAGFNVANLERLLQPYAREELLYFRDDDHWNERGHAVVADLIRRSPLTQPSARGPNVANRALALGGCATPPGQ